jgi:hypothetical protein
MSKQERNRQDRSRPRAARDGREPLNHASRDPARDLPRDPAHDLSRENRSRIRPSPAPTAQAGGGPDVEELERQGRLFK